MVFNNDRIKEGASQIEYSENRMNGFSARNFLEGYMRAVTS